MSPARRLSAHTLFDRRQFATLLAVGAGLALDAAAPAPASGAPKPDLWPRWRTHDAQSAARLDHGDWDALLARYLKSGDDGINRFAYGALSAPDRARLAGYLARLSATAVGELNRAEQKAFWINLYNALTVDVVLRHYPVDSIRDIRISPSLFSFGPWGKRLVTVAGEPLSLDDIEHRILRPIWRDPRIHYGLNCASIGCPNLAARAYTGANVDDLLAQGARAFINHPRGVEVRDGKLKVSSLYDWFKIDFGGDDAGVIAHLKRHAAADLRRRLDRVRRINDDDYDWRLNAHRGAGE